MSRAGYIRLGLVVAVLLAIELACRGGLIKPGLLVPVSAMVTELLHLLQTEEFWRQLSTSASSIVIAFVSAMTVGCLAALALFRFPRLRKSLEPLIASYYALPIFALYPVLIVIFGMNQGPIILLGFLFAVVAVIVGTLNGLDRIPGVLIRAGRTMHLSPWQQGLLVSLPAASPYVFTGAKLAFGYSITGVLGSEFILATSGYGYSIAFAYNNFEDRKMYALILFLVIVVALITWGFSMLERRIQHRASAAKTRIEEVRVTPRDKILSALAVFALILLGWEVVHLIVGPASLASPALTFGHMLDLFAAPAFWANVAETLRALGLAALISCLGGAVLGLIIGLDRMTTEVLSPVFVTLYAIPKLTLYPVVLLFFGLGMSSKVAFGIMHGMIPMLLIAIVSIRSLNTAMLSTARTMRLSRMQTLTTVVIPAVIPEIITGIRVSFSITLLGVMVGEMFASSRGLGYMIMNAIQLSNTQTMMAVTVLIGTFAVVVNSTLLAVETRVHHR